MLPDWETTLKRPACGRNSRKPTALSRLCVADQAHAIGADQRDARGARPFAPAQPPRRLPPRPASEKSAATTSATGCRARPHCETTALTWVAPSVTQRQVRAFGQLRDAAEAGQAAQRGPPRRFHG